MILGALGAFVVTFATGSSHTAALAVQGVRAYEAARVGIEWGSYQIQDTTGAGGTDTPRDCFASPAGVTLPTGFDGFTLQVTCERFPASGAVPNYHEEGNRRVAVYVLTATAWSGTAGALEFVERRLEARVEVCKDPDAAVPYVCS